jgi:methylmalonyl-CoA/ethylmalonyl-CoA epimerase
MLTHIDHLGIAVLDLDASMALYRSAFGVATWEIIEIPERHMRVAIANIGGTLIELIMATSEEAAFAKYLREHGPGIHHIAYRVDDIQNALSNLAGQGMRLIDEAPRPGIHNTQVAFIHPKATQGVLIELVQH